MSHHNYRLYTFVAGNYLSELQKGLQTAHVVSEMVKICRPTIATPPAGWKPFCDWADTDKTIIILTANNHAGVETAFAALSSCMSAIWPGVAAALFYEDKESMNCMATACGIIVPQVLWDVTYTPAQSFTGTEGLAPSWRPAFYQHIPVDGCPTVTYAEGSAEFSFCKLLKSFRSA